ncbi:L-2-hydroxyglutarate oxidase [Oscillochloris sp. ZM17-4]|uniref:L-2-hydroxyglutarate oxidase n=1 Tax=Oscillochloris sp. ZM17-4 TaxID=2866714 RepID=UPI001C73D068|nr:L-2-hydroxyglutarate oxidase [Oscillochloris sp. ZM17-4]MBX0328812.1 L-2-hydroxyglutarate oxidase [Oscillochloris sp. ZM17-4]
MPTYDYLIVGGGIVGLSTAMALGTQHPQAKIAVCEKESRWAAHQTGNNSGVIHAGVYYKPGSLKAQFARAGQRSMVAFCQEQGIAYEVCGKLIVATAQSERERLENLYQRALANGLEAQKIGPEQIREREPHVRAVAGIYIPSTGIVNYTQVSEAYARIVREQGGELHLSTRVLSITERGDLVTVETSRGAMQARFLINCAGLHSDRVADMSGARTGMKIIPFRGEYYELVPEKRHMVKGLIYPVPNPNFPFLGVHFTRMIDGTVHAGPNAVLALKREGYRKTDIDLRDLGEVLSYPAFWKLAGKYMGEGVKEMLRSASKALFVRSMQQIIPDIKPKDVVPTHAGVRAQALMHDGTLMDDFVIINGERSIHICNAPSPAATASIEIGKAIVERIPAPERRTLLTA